jgi:hypothetical protein
LKLGSGILCCSGFTIRSHPLNWLGLQNEALASSVPHSIPDSPIRFCSLPIRMEHIRQVPEFLRLIERVRSLRSRSMSIDLPAGLALCLRNLGRRELNSERPPFHGRRKRCCLVSPSDNSWP